jgi:hypothetical protein
MNIRKILSIAVPTLVLGSAARADLLFTPPLDPGGTADKVLECHIVNVSNAVRRVRIQVLSADGRVIRSTVTFPLLPMQSSLNAANGLEVVPAPGYCKFAVDSSKSAVRAAAVIRGGDEPVTTAALPAE